jgi:hypothetical protein
VQEPYWTLRKLLKQEWSVDLASEKPLVKNFAWSDDSPTPATSLFLSASELSIGGQKLNLKPMDGSETTAFQAECEPPVPVPVGDNWKAVKSFTIKLAQDGKSIVIDLGVTKITKAGGDSQVPKVHLPNLSVYTKVEDIRVEISRILVK